MKSLFRILFFIFVPFLATAQDFGIKFSGFVKSDFMYDTRQTVTIREGDFLLFPAAKSLDKDGNDLNAKSSLNFLSIQSRLSGAITAPDFLGAKVTGVLEADFFGNENASFVDANGFRLRHAFGKLTWGNTELLIGQYWHPFFAPNCFAEVLSFNTGAPFQPFSRNPQIRLTQKMNDLSLILAIATQRDFASYPSSVALRNSGLPIIDALLQYNVTGFNSGVGIDFKKLIPTFVTGNGYQTDEGVSSLSATGFFKVSSSALTWKAQATYGANASDLTMLGGYVVKEASTDGKATLKYTTINNLSVWTELIYAADKNLNLGLFVGYAKNLGSSDVIGTYTAATVRGSNIDNVMRVSPRVVYTVDKFSLGFELEYTAAAYATKALDTNGKVTDSESLNNVRGLFSAILKF